MSKEAWELVERPTQFDDYNWHSDDVPARKFYGFIAEIGRRLRPLMTDPGPIAMIDLCQQCADGQLAENDLAEMADGYRAEDCQDLGASYVPGIANDLYYWVADRYKVHSRSFSYAVGIYAAQAAIEAGALSPTARWHEEVQAVLEQPKFAEIVQHTALEWGGVLRDIYGNDPFGAQAVDASSVFDPAWCTPAVRALLGQITERWDLPAMPILADALEEAGCDHRKLLDHLRSPAAHVRGCWALDVVLGR